MCLIKDVTVIDKIRAKTLVKPSTGEYYHWSEEYGTYMTSLIPEVMPFSANIDVMRSGKYCTPPPEDAVLLEVEIIVKR